MHKVYWQFASFFLLFLWNIDVHELLFQAEYFPSNSGQSVSEDSLPEKKGVWYLRYTNVIQTPTAHPALPPTPPSLFSFLCLIFFAHYPPPQPPSFQAYAYDVRSAAFYFIDIPCFFKTMQNEIIQYAYFVCTIHAIMSFSYFVNNVRIFILHCHYDCLLSFTMYVEKCKK